MNIDNEIQAIKKRLEELAEMKKKARQDKAIKEVIERQKIFLKHFQSLLFSYKTGDNFYSKDQILKQIENAKKTLVLLGYSAESIAEIK